MPIDSCDSIKGGNVLLQCRACGESISEIQSLLSGLIQIQMRLA